MSRMIWVWVAVGFGIAAVGNYLAALSWLTRRGEKIVFPLLGLFLPRYLSRYRELTWNEAGRAGIHFHGYIVSFVLALGAFIVFLTKK